MLKEVQVSRPTREIYCKRSASLRREQLCTAGENKHYVVASSSLGHKIESNEKAPSSPSPQPCTEAMNLETPYQNLTSNLFLPFKLLKVN